MFLPYLVLLLSLGSLGRGRPQINLTFSPTTLTMIEEETVQLEINVTYSDTVSQLELYTHPLYPKVIKLSNCMRHLLTPHNQTAMLSFPCNVTGLRLGSSAIRLNYFNLSAGDDAPSQDILGQDYMVVVLRKSGPVELAFRYCIIFLVVTITFLMGCGLEFRIIVGYLKKPIAPAIGFLSQYLLMPLIAFGLGQVTQLAPEFAFGLLTIGCSPGGGGSNVWTVLLNGDLNLSMTMTFLSTIAAMGMMPLWIFIFARFYIDTSKVNIPYHMIAINLIQIVVPVLLGMLLKHLKPAWATKAAKLTKLFALLFVVFIITFGTYANLYMYRLLGDYPILLPIGAGLPWLGFLFGFGISMLLRQGRAKSVTIALETGIQNIGIPILILLYSMPQPQGALGGTMPIVVAIFTPIPLYLILIGMTIRRRFCHKATEDEVKTTPPLEDAGQCESQIISPSSDVMVDKADIELSELKAADVHAEEEQHRGGQNSPIIHRNPTDLNSLVARSY